MRLALLALALLVTGCDPDVEPTETSLDNLGSVCISEAAVRVDFETCLSSSCDTLSEESCTVTLEEDVLVVTSVATLTTQGDECTADCGFSVVTCDLPSGWEAATTLSYGGTDVDVATACQGF
jgi:hypothetical protein